MPSRDEGQKRGGGLRGLATKSSGNFLPATLRCFAARAFLSSCGFTIWPGESFLRFVAQLTRGKERERGEEGERVKC